MTDAMVTSKTYEPEVVYVNEFIDFSKSKLLFVDTETSGLGRFDAIGGVGIMDENGVGTYLAYGHKLGDNLRKEDVLEYCTELFSDPNVVYVFHNSKFDIGMFRHDYIEFAGEIRDTMIYASLLNENRLSYQLKVLAKQDLGMAPEEKSKLTAWLKANGYKDWEVLKAPVSLAGLYCYGDILRTKALYDLYYPQILGNQYLNAIAHTECRFAQSLSTAEMKGIAVDVDALQKDKLTYSEEIKQLTSDIRNLVGVKTFNALSPLHLEQYFLKQKLKIYRTVKGELQFDKKVLRKTLAGLSSFDHDNVVEIETVLHKILKLRDRNTVLTTFIEKYLELQIGGRVYPSFNALRGEKGGAITGRMSCDSPNLQNVKNPRKDRESGEVVDGGARKYFVPDRGKVLLSIDYSQIEYRIFVHYANDAKLIKAYQDNPWIDYHKTVADLLAVSRKVGKGLNFGLLYAMGKVHLAESLGYDPNDAIEFAEAVKLFHSYHSTFPSVKRLRDDVTNVMINRRYVRNVFGRFRHIGPPVGSNRDERYKSLNSLIQGCAADLLKDASVKVDAVMQEKTPYADLLLWEHDELVFQLPITKIDEFTNIVVPIMQDYPQFKVPIRVDVELFKENWAEGTPIVLEWNK